MKTTIAFLLLAGQCFAQGALQVPYRFTDELTCDTCSSGFVGQAPDNLAAIGEYWSMLKTNDVNARQARPLSARDSLYATTLVPQDMFEYLERVASEERIVIINESHRKPHHRVVITSLLEQLYAKGFRYLGMETLSHEDSLLNSRKYPVHGSGYYTREPLAGDVVRRALEIGYVVFAYESLIFDTLPITPTSVSVREIEQAKNIKKMLDMDPSAKFIIHCGHDHLVETPYRGWGMAMAGRLKEYTGIDPFTIDQEPLSERSDRSLESAFYRALYADRYAFFVDEAGGLFNGTPGKDRCDVLLYHPRTTWEQGRPDWVFSNGRTPQPIADRITVGFPCLVMAYRTTELTTSDDPDDAPIPFDVVEIRSVNEPKPLALRSGSYTVVVRDREGDLQRFELEVNTSR